jgi:hypothetical protein
VPPDWPPQLEQLAQQIPWWGLLVWAVMIRLYLAVPWALLKGRSALGLFVGAFVKEIVRWVPRYLLPAYRETWAGGSPAISLPRVGGAGRGRPPHRVG